MKAAWTQLKDGAAERKRNLLDTMESQMVRSIKNTSSNSVCLPVQSWLISFPQTGNL